MAQMVKNPPAIQETWVRSLGREDPLDEGMATPSSILAWRIPMDRGAWQTTVHGGRKESDTTKRLHFSFTFMCQAQCQSLHLRVVLNSHNNFDFSQTNSCHSLTCGRQHYW